MVECPSLPDLSAMPTLVAYIRQCHGQGTDNTRICKSFRLTEVIQYRDRLGRPGQLCTKEVMLLSHMYKRHCQEKIKVCFTNAYGAL